VTALITLGISLYRDFFLGNITPPNEDFLLANILIQGVLVLWMLRDCLKRDFPSVTSRVNWLTAIVFFGVFGTTLYYFRVKNGKPRASAIGI